MVLNNCDFLFFLALKLRGLVIEVNGQKAKMFLKRDYNSLNNGHLLNIEMMACIVGV